MSGINRKEVESLGRIREGKNDKGLDNQKLNDYFLKSLDELKIYYKNATSYELSQMINHIDHWVKDDRENPYYDNYEVGSILYVDFGAMNFGFELSFPHPCVVLAQRKAFMLVAPCSTKKYGHNYDDILDGTLEDGFEYNTGIIVDNVRWISKGRVIAKMGKVNESFLKKLVQATVSYLPSL